MAYNSADNSVVYLSPQEPQEHHIFTRVVEYDSNYGDENETMADEDNDMTFILPPVLRRPQYQKSISIVHNNPEDIDMEDI